MQWPRGQELQPDLVTAVVGGNDAPHTSLDDWLRLADLWAHTGPPCKGLYADGFHPNDKGYRQWADAVAEALALSPG